MGSGGEIETIEGRLGRCRIVERVGTVADESHLSSLIVSPMSATKEGSLVCIMWLTPVARQRWAIAEGEFLWDIGKLVKPARAIAISLMK